MLLHNANRLLQLLCTHPSIINHIVTDLRQFYYIPEMIQRLKDRLGSCASPDDGSVSLETCET